MAARKPVKRPTSRVAKAMAADRKWDRAHRVQANSWQDKAIDQAARRRARKGK